MKTFLGRPSSGWKNNVKMYRNETGPEDGRINDWIFQWRCWTSWFHNRLFLDNMKNYILPKEGSVPWCYCVSVWINTK